MARSAPVTKKMTGTNPTKQPMYPGRPSMPGKTAVQYGSGLVKDNTNYDIRKPGSRSVKRLQNSGLAEKGTGFSYKKSVGYKTPISKPKTGTSTGFKNEYSDQSGGAGRRLSKGTQKGA